MVAVLINPEQQFVDANGAPYVGGLLSTYVVGTSTPKTTYVDPAGASANTNPVVLDAAGRCLIYGDGAYRLVLTDANGNEIFDQPSSTYVSAAMAPVCIAPDLPTALSTLGVTAAIAAEAALRASADNTEITARTAAVAAEAARAEAAEAAVSAAVTAETSRAEAAEAALSASLSGLTGTGVRAGASGPTDANGHYRTTFHTPTGGVQPAVSVTLIGSGLFSAAATITSDQYGFDVWFAMPWGAPAVGNMFWWIAMTPTG